MAGCPASTSAARPSTAQPIRASGKARLSATAAGTPWRTSPMAESLIMTIERGAAIAAPKDWSGLERSRDRRSRTRPISMRVSRVFREDHGRTRISPRAPRASRSSPASPTQFATSSLQPKLCTSKLFLGLGPWRAGDEEGGLVRLEAFRLEWLRDVGVIWIARRKSWQCVESSVAALKQSS